MHEIPLSKLVLYFKTRVVFTETNMLDVMLSHEPKKIVFPENSYWRIKERKKETVVLQNTISFETKELEFRFFGSMISFQIDAISFVDAKDIPKTITINS